MDKEEPSYGKGSFLIANPVLPDTNFSRTVILLCNHDEEGSFGLVVNKSAGVEPSQIFANIDVLSSYQSKVFLGGPVSQEQLFYLVRSEEAIPELDQVCKNVYLGFQWEMLETVYNRLENPNEKIRFYLGYSGWGSGQLAGEMDRKSWLTCDADLRYVFYPDENNTWASVVRSMGEEYQYLTQAPVNPQWN
jgi:putative transcriptional regulator